MKKTQRQHMFSQSVWESKVRVILTPQKTLKAITQEFYASRNKILHKCLKGQIDKVMTFYTQSRL